MNVEEALRKLGEAATKRAEAKGEYREAIEACVENKVSNVKMAKIAGVSETAIRLYRSRNGI